MKSSTNTPTRYNIDNTYFDARLLKDVSTGKIHWHSHFLISVFTKNEGIQHLNNVEYHFESGTAIMMGPFDFHYNEVKENETFDAYSIKFSYKVFNERLLNICALNHFPVICKLKDEDYVMVKNLCDFLTKEKNNVDSKEKEILVNNIIEQLIILILRNSDNKNFHTVSDIKIRRALIYIHDNFKSDISLKNVADICHYTPNYFSSLFKKEMGVTFQNYVNNLRLEFAFNMINYANKSCTDACFESGFNSLEYFSYSFKKKYGKSPKYYIKS